MRDCLTGESMSEKIKSLIDRLGTEHRLSKEEWVTVFSEWDDEDRAYAAEKARALSLAQFGNKIFIRGIVEFSNICKNDCLYCGIRRSNTNAERYPSPRRRYSPAARRGMSTASAPLCCRAARTTEPTRRRGWRG